MTDFRSMLPEVAKILWGPPRKGATKTEIRYGDQRTVNPQKGVWWDHGDEIGGGVLDLIRREKGIEGKTAIEWLRSNGFHIDDNRPVRMNGDGHHHPQGEPPPPPPNDERDAPPTIVATYDYTDETGDLLVQVCRMENGEADPKTGKAWKTFRQRRPDPARKDGWNWSAAGVRQVPYRLAELQEAVAQDLTVYLVEGEKAADRLRAEGVPATTNLGGAGKFPDELCQFFAGASVVILPDNDPQTLNKDGSPRFHADGSPVFPGQDHAAHVAQRLMEVAASVRVLELPVPPKGDVVEWFEAGGTVDALYDLTEARSIPAEVYVKEKPWQARAVPFRSRFGAITWDRLDDPGPEVEWLVKDWLTRGSRSMVAGASQAGKSFFVLDMALAIARGVDFFGHRTVRGGVIYQAGEGGLGLKKRLRAYRLRHTIEEALPFVLLPETVDLYASEDQTTELIAEIQHWRKTFDVPLELVVIDTYAAATPGSNENASEDVSRVLKRLDRVARACSCHVMLVHHMNADGNRPRGHTSVFANLDNVIIVRTEEGRSDANGRGVRRAVVTKQKDGEAGTKLDFVLRAIETARDSYGDPVTSCTIEEPYGEIARPSDARVTTNDWLLLRAIHDALSNFGVAAPSSLNLPRSITAVVAWRHVRQAMDALSFEDDEDPKKRANNIKMRMARNGQKLLEHGIIGRSHPYVWLTGKGFTGEPIAPDAGAAAAAPDPDDDPLSGW